ncbi:MAG: hypothetical protein AAFX53_02620 [Bacteroidota bacterium]
MKKLLDTTLLLLVVFTIIAVSCGESCNDCIELSSKNVRIVDTSGNNLLFGDQKRYPPDSVRVTTSSQLEIPVWVDSLSGTIQFALEADFSEYYFFLTDRMIDTLEFGLSEQKSQECCGMKTISTKTFLNGLEIDNTDTLTLVK